MIKQSSVRFWRRLASKPWFLAALLILAIADLFIVVIPIEGLTLAAVLSNRKNWLRPAIVLALGSTLGCIALAEFTYRNAPWVLSHLGSLHGSTSWNWVQNHINTLGAGIVIIGAYTPIPLQVLATAPALAGLRPEILYPALALGRLGRAVLLCWAASHARSSLTRVLARFQKAQKEYEELND